MLPDPQTPIQLDRNEDVRIVNGVIKYKYPEISESEVGKYYSCAAVRIGDFDWWIELGKEECESNGGHALSFWCKCQPVKEEVKDWKCYAELEFRLLPRDKDEEKVITWSLSDVLTPESAAVGFYDFEDWKCIRDTRKGYCKRNSIKVEVIVREMYPFMTTSGMPDMKFKLKDGRVMYSLTTAFDLQYLVQPDVLITFRNICFYAHSSMLNRFKQFRARLGKQKQKSEMKKIELPYNTSLNAFLSVLSFLYTWRLIINPDNLIDLVSCASSLKFTAILKAAIPLVTPAHVLQVMDIAVRDSNDDLLCDCWPVFCKDAVKILYRTQFLKISKDLLKQILVQENMSCDELDLFLRSLDWSVEECLRNNLPVTPENQRAMISDGLFNIRFPCMQLQDLQYHVRQSGILTEDELSLVKTFIEKKKRLPDLLFPTEKRKSFTE